MKRIFALFICGLGISNLSLAGQLTSTVKELRTFPEKQSVASARNHVVFNLDTPFSGGCDWVYLAPTDKTSISLLLAAKLAKAPVKVTYSNEPSPWHAPTCTVVEISMP